MAPLWSGDGASILFLSDGDGSFNLYGMDKNGEQQVRKTSIANLKIGADW
jgi:Tol biopolymer transport system component